MLGASPQFQSTHPRGVRHTGDMLPCLPEAVSIHAPAWGATCAGRGPCGRPGRFQSTHPRGVRLEGGTSSVREQGVSIHAPAWGATQCGAESLALNQQFQSTHPRGVRRHGRRDQQAGRQGFNPRTRVGCDAQVSGLPFAACWFQSTHPRGVRPQAYQDPVGIWTFQSTHPRGVRRTRDLGMDGCAGVSIHAPAWGATVSMFYPVDSRD